MKRFALLLFALFLVVAGSRTARALEVNFSFFYDSLSPYGDWVDAGAYGYCWQPRGVPADWAPYTDGYWVHTDAGWTWVSYEEYGSVTYHYGRWARVDGLGWIWKPDYEWAPAWVSWRYSDDYIGWAPLPPEVVFDSGVGISVWVDRDYGIGPGYYNFCDVRSFGSPVMRNVIYPRSRNTVIIEKTVNVTNITYRSDRRWVYNGGPDYHRVSSRSHRKIESLKLDRRTGDGIGGWRHTMRPAKRSGDRLVVEAPRVRRDNRDVRPPKVARKYDRVQADRGWREVSNRKDRERIESHYRRQQPDRPENRADRPREPREQATRPPQQRAEQERQRERTDRANRERQQREQAARPPQQRAEQERQRERNERASRDRQQREQASRQQQQRAEQQRQRERNERASRERQQREQAARQQQQRAEQQRQRERNERASRERQQREQAARQQQKRAEPQRQRERNERSSRERPKQERAERSKQSSKKESRKKENRQKSDRRDQDRKKERDKDRRR